MPLLAMIICSAATSATPTPESPGIPAIPFEKYTLPNGLSVILHEDHATPIVGVNVWYHVGSKDERPGRTGFAHLFEHMMFQGSEHYDKVYFGPIQAVGGRLNGSTATDRTNYWETVPANYLELALWMESDRMGFLLPAMTQAKLDNQRDVVKNERRQSYENRPYGLVHEVILAAMYPPDDPSSWPPIGSMKDVTAASREDIADFFRRYYNAGNASLCIAGDFDPKDARRWVAKYFGPLPAGPKVVHPGPIAERKRGQSPVVQNRVPNEVCPAEGDRVPSGCLFLAEEKRIHMTDRVGLARLYLTWPTPREFTPEDAQLDVLAHVLAGSKVARLYQSLVRRREIAQDVHASQHGEERSGTFSIVATARPGHKLAELETAVTEELVRLQSEPPTAEEVARAVNGFVSHAVRALEPVSEFGGRADRLNRYNVLTGDPGYMKQDFARYDQVTPAAVRQAAAKFLGRGRVVVEVEPGKHLTITPDPRQAAEAARDELARRQKYVDLPDARFAGSQRRPSSAGDSGRGPLPQGGQEPAFHAPRIQRAKLSCGTEVLLVEKHELPLVTLHMVFPAGWGEGSEQPGLADLTAAVWDEGTRNRSAEQIAKELTDIGATLSVGCDWDTTTVRLFTLKRHLAKALDVYADVLRNPAFSPAEVDRQRRMALGRLAQVRNEPLFLAPLAAHQLLYGPGTYYGHSQLGSPKVLKALASKNLQGFYEKYMNPRQAALIAVGDVTMPELTAGLEKTLAGWPGEKIPDAEPGTAEEEPPQPTRIVLIDKPAAAQSVIHVALLIDAQPKSPDYFKLLVMDMVFGGQFSSRLNLNLREQKGYTYGAKSRFDWRVSGPGPFVATASVQTGVTAPALSEFLKELDGMRGARPIQAKELDFCKKFITRGYTAGFETPSQLAGQLETLWTYKLPDDYFNTVLPGVGAVTANDVLGVAKKVLDPNRLVIVVVGDRKAVEPALRKLPLGKTLKVMKFDEEFHLVPSGE